MRRTLLALLIPLSAGLLAPASIAAQGENAMPMHGGSFRVSIGADWAHYDERFGAATPLRPALPDGTREPLGFYFGADSFGVAQLPFLNPLQGVVQSVTGLGNFALNLGTTRLVLDASVRRQPIRIAFAPSTRLGFQVTVPLVRARMSAFLAAPDTSLAARGNVGAITATTFDQFRTQADTALLALANQAANGPAGLRAQAQATLASIQPLVCGLWTLVTAVTPARTPCTTLSGANLLPVTGTVAGDSITTRLGRAQASYAALVTQYQALGVTLPAFNAAFALPTARIDSTGLRNLLAGSGSAGDSVSEIVRTGIGDIEVGGWLQLANGASLRSQVAVLVRLPTGKMDAPGNYIDIGTGDHQTDVEVSLRNDVVLNRNLWFHLGGRYGVQMADQLDRRITPYYLPFAPAPSQARVNRNLGDYYAIDVAPNWQLDDSFGVALGWHYFHQGATTYTLDAASTPGLPDPALLAVGTAQSMMRIGAGVTFSTLERYMAGRARLPYRVTWSYNSTFYGRGGQVPKAGVMMVEIQAFFGNLR